MKDPIGKTVQEIVRENYMEGIPTGTVLHLEGGTKLLVGDINPLGGVCDDCRHPELRLKVVKISNVDW